MKLFDKWYWRQRRFRKEESRTQRNVTRYKTLTIKSWENIELEYQKDERWPRAIAAVDETDWFGMAINCMRDGQMGKQDEDGVYERFWATDQASDIDLRNATPAEADLYLKKVPMRGILCAEHEIGKGPISVVRLDGVTYIIYPEN